MAETVLVTGGAGFVGSHVVDALVAAGRSVTVLDSRHPRSHAAPAHHLNPDATYVRGDVRDADAVRAAIRAVGAVSHHAALVGLGAAFTDVVDYAAVNDLGTAVLLRELAATRFRGRLVLASSMVVYGEGGYRCPRDGPVRPAPRTADALAAGRFDPPCPRCGSPLEAEPVTEAAPAEPRNVYAATKLHQEHLCAAFERECGVPVAALRYHNVYGPRMPRDTPYAGVASIFRSALERGEAPRVNEDGRQLRDFVHVRDVAHANVLALLADEPPRGAFNVASGEPRSVGDLARALAAAHAPAPEPVVTGDFRLGDVRHVFASPERAARRLGFRARVPFADGMRELATAPVDV